MRVQLDLWVKIPFYDGMLVPENDPSALQPGQLLARGVVRHMMDIGYASLLEFIPSRGLRVDVMAMATQDELWIVECKSSRADFISDKKWQNYLEWCDRYFWAVDPNFDLDLLPPDTGIILSDGYGAEIIRPAPLNKLAAARRKTLIKKIATQAANRLIRLQDPNLTL